MDFEKLRGKLIAKGYSTDTANAKIAHDVVIAAVKAAGFHDNLTIKGGVVMSGITNVVRRATMDMDVDFLRYPLADASIRKFVTRLNRVSDCKIAISGAIKPLKQQEYKGKRIYLRVTDGFADTVETKIDIGVHTRTEVVQSDFGFKVVTDGSSVQLLVNPKEQIFVEKLKSLLRFGSASTRFKDVYDMYYLRTRVRKTVLRTYLKIYVYDDPKMRENDREGIVRRLTRVFADKRYMRDLANPAFAWLNVGTKDVANGLLAFVSSL